MITGDSSLADAILDRLPHNARPVAGARPEQRPAIAVELFGATGRGADRKVQDREPPLARPIGASSTGQDRPEVNAAWPMSRYASFKGRVEVTGSIHHPSPHGRVRTSNTLSSP